MPETALKHHRRGTFDLGTPGLRSKSDPIVSKNRVEYVRVIDLLNDHRLLLYRDLTGEALAQREANPLTEGCCDPPAGGGGDWLLGGLSRAAARWLCRPEGTLAPGRAARHRSSTSRWASAASVTCWIRCNRSSSGGADPKRGQMAYWYDLVGYLFMIERMSERELGCGVRRSESAANDVQVHAYVTSGRVKWCC